MGITAAIIVFNSTFHVACPTDVAAERRVIVVTMPRNPERPMRATNCEEAEDRLQEAEKGSPLVSQRENRDILARAKAQVERMCRDNEEIE
jgi:hypothetical protein